MNSSAASTMNTASGSSDAASESNLTPKLECDRGNDETEEPFVHESAETASYSYDSPKEILKALETVERDSVAIAESFASLFASLRLSLSQATSNTVDHMNCLSDAAGRLQECVLDSSTKGNHYINSCLRLNEDMKGTDALATKLKILRRYVDALDSAVNRVVRLP